MSLDEKFLALSVKCPCSNEPGAIPDGYTIDTLPKHLRPRCMRCFGNGVVHKKISLSDLKLMLDGYV